MTSSMRPICLLVLLLNACTGQFQRPASQQNQINRGATKASASCPERNGRFPVASQCDAYVECIDGVAEEKLCPEGLVFNPDVRFNYPCGYPIDVNCEGRPNLQPAQSTEDCPHQYGYFKIGDKANCGQFVNCAAGRAYLFQCPEGLAYNSASYRCDWPDQVADCDVEAYLGFSCPHEVGSLLQGDTRFFRSPVDCQHYYVCITGKPRLMNCGDGYAFDTDSGTCKDAKNVTGCPSQSNRQGVKQTKLTNSGSNYQQTNNQYRQQINNQYQNRQQQNNQQNNQRQTYKNYG